MRSGEVDPIRGTATAPPGRFQCECIRWIADDLGSPDRADDAVLVDRGDRGTGAYRCDRRQFDADELRRKQIPQPAFDPGDQAPVGGRGRSVQPLALTMILSADWWCRRGLRRRARYLIGRLRGEVCKALAGGLSAASTVGGRAAGFLDRWSGRGVRTVRRGAVAGGSGEVLLPRQRGSGSDRMHARLAAAVEEFDPMLPGRLRASLRVPDGSRNASNASSRGHWVTLPDAASTNLRSRNIPGALPGRSTR